MHLLEGELSADAACRAPLLARSSGGGRPKTRSQGQEVGPASRRRLPDSRTTARWSDKRRPVSLGPASRRQRPPTEAVARVGTTRRVVIADGVASRRRRKRRSAADGLAGHRRAEEAQAQPPSPSDQRCRRPLASASLSTRRASGSLREGCCRGLVAQLTMRQCEVPLTSLLHCEGWALRSALSIGLSTERWPRVGSAPLSVPA